MIALTCRWTHGGALFQDLTRYDSDEATQSPQTAIHGNSLNSESSMSAASSYDRSSFSANSGYT